MGVVHDEPRRAGPPLKGAFASLGFTLRTQGMPVSSLSKGVSGLGDEGGCRVVSRLTSEFFMCTVGRMEGPSLI